MHMYTSAYTQWIFIQRTYYYFLLYSQEYKDELTKYWLDPIDSTQHSRWYVFHELRPVLCMMWYLHMYRSSEWLHVQPCFQLAQGRVMISLHIGRLLLLEKNFCLISLQPNNSSVVYAGEILKLYNNHNITASLANHGITPSDRKSYSVSKLNTTCAVYTSMIILLPVAFQLMDIKNAVGGTLSPILGCRVS